MGAVKKFKEKVRKLVNRELEDYFDALEEGGTGKSIYNMFNSPTQCAADFAGALVESMEKAVKEEEQSNEPKENDDEAEEGENKGRKFQVIYIDKDGARRDTVVTGASQNHVSRMFFRENSAVASIESVTEITTQSDL